MCCNWQQLATVQTHTHTLSFWNTHSNTITATERHLSPFIDSMIGFVWTFLKYKNLQSKCLKFLQLFPPPPPRPAPQLYIRTRSTEHPPLMPQYMPLSVCWPLACVFWFLFSFFFFWWVAFFAVFVFCLFAFCSSFWLFALRCFNAIFALFCFSFFLPRTFGFSHLRPPPLFPPLAPAGCYCRLTVRLAQVAHVSSPLLSPELPELLLFCCWLGSSFSLFFGP